MNLTQKLIEDILFEIERKNRNLNPAAVPHSDLFIKYLLSTLGISVETAKNAIRLLADSHKIFVMEIVAEDGKRNIDRVEGYISAEKEIVTNLKTYFQDLLCQMYEKQFHKRLLIHQVIKEIFPIIKSFNNTELGQVANKTIMIMEYERLLDKDISEYNDEYKEQSMLELADREKISYIPKAGVKVEFSNFKAKTPDKDGPGVFQMSFTRAVDSPTYQEFSEKKNKYPLQRILNIYGIDFFVKVSMRKCQFSYLKQLVDDKQITKKEDLLLLKSTLDTIKANIFHDKELDRNRNEIYDLERTVTHAIYFTTHPPKK